MTQMQYVKNQLEKVPDRFTPIWKWRSVEEGKNCNGLEEGEAGPREMSKLRLAKRKYVPLLSQINLIIVCSPRLSIHGERVWYLFQLSTVECEIRRKVTTLAPAFGQNWTTKTFKKPKLWMPKP